MNTPAAKRERYALSVLIPEDLLQEIPYKHVYEALSMETEEDSLKDLVAPFVSISLWNAYENFDSYETKRDKKDVMRHHVWLDALI